MTITRLFSTDAFKGTEHYLDTQKKYETARTILYFGISAAVFLAGIFTKTRMNLLTIVAVLGCLPACKSLVGMIMFLRYKSCSAKAAEEIKKNIGELTGLYDMVFTAYEQNFPVSHLTVKGNTVCGYTEWECFNEQAFYKHLDGILKLDGFKEVSVKIFFDLDKYTVRLRQLNQLEAEEKNTEGIIETLKNVVL